MDEQCEHDWFNRSSNRQGKNQKCLKCGEERTISLTVDELLQLQRDNLERCPKCGWPTWWKLVSGGLRCGKCGKITEYDEARIAIGKLVTSRMEYDRKHPECKSV